MLLTNAAIEALLTSFSTQYRSAYADSSPWWSQVATLVPSSNASNTYGWMARIPAMRQWVGPRILQNLNTHAQTITNRPFELSVAVDRDDLEDENLGVYQPLMQELGRAAAKWPDQLLRAAIQAGDTTTLGFDGLSMFNNAHTLDPGGTQDNLFGLALTPANYATVREAMMAFTGEDGEPLGIVPDLLVVPPQLDRQAREILNADIIAQGGAGVTNVLKSSASLLTVSELANEATAWYLFDTSKPIKPFIWQLRRAPELVSKTQPNEDGVFYDKQLVWGVDGRGEVGAGPWFLGSQGNT